MQRLRAALTPAAFFAGMTLICGSVIEFQRWPWTITRLLRSDLEADLPDWWPETFSALVGLLIIGTFIIQGAPALRGPVLSAAGVATAMIGVTVHYAGSAVEASGDACHTWYQYEGQRCPAGRFSLLACCSPLASSSR